MKTLHPKTERVQTIEEGDVAKISAKQILRDHFERKRQQNPSYSLRAFARDVGVSASILSRTLHGQRPISLKLAFTLSAALDLKEADYKFFLASVLEEAPKTAKISRLLRSRILQQLKENPPKGPPTKSFEPKILEIETFKALANPMSLAVLNLIETVGFKEDPAWISNRLGISQLEVRDILERLYRLDLIQKIRSKNSYKTSRTHKNLHIPTSRSQAAIRAFHKSMIQKSLVQLEKTSENDFKNRLINGSTLRLHPDQIPQIKKLIDDFQEQIVNLLNESPLLAQEVYQLNVQFFPLTQSKRRTL